MPVVDRREFGGRFSVRENSQRLANYRYLEVQLMEMIAGWCHTTPQIAFKATFGYHVYDHAQAADLLGERLEQLRSTRDSQEPGTDEFARLCEMLWKVSQCDSMPCPVTPPDSTSFASMSAWTSSASRRFSGSRVSDSRTA